MNLSKQQSKFLALAVFLIFFGVVFFLIRKDHTTPSGIPSATTGVTRPIASSSLATSLVATPSEAPSGASRSLITLHDFTRSETKNGKRMWDLTADTGRYLAGSNAILLSNPLLHLFRPDGDSMELRSEKATITLTGTTLSKALLEGRVVAVSKSNYTIRTERAEYNKDDSTIVAPGEVTLEGPLVDIRGEDLLANVDKKTVLLKKNVHTTIKKRIKL